MASPKLVAITDVHTQIKVSRPSRAPDVTLATRLLSRSNITVKTEKRCTDAKGELRRFNVNG